MPRPLKLVRIILGVSAVATLVLVIATGFYGPQALADARVKVGGNVAVITVWLAAIAHAALDSRQKRGPRRWLLMAVLVLGSFPAGIVYFLHVVLADRNRASSGTSGHVAVTPDVGTS